ncbi:MAG TPA: hypothetical protein VJ739_10710 [Gemmataceae bacterium]|nr:hypothetical protein [Gemmataceae bacterium]
MIPLTEEQRRALQGESPPRLVDPSTNETYVLLRAAVYDRLKGLLEEDLLSMEEVARLVEETMREDDANDPLLEGYQKYLEQP